METPVPPWVGPLLGLTANTAGVVGAAWPRPAVPTSIVPAINAAARRSAGARVERSRLILPTTEAPIAWSRGILPPPGDPDGTWTESIPVLTERQMASMARWCRTGRIGEVQWRVWCQTGRIQRLKGAKVLGSG